MGFSVCVQFHVFKDLCVSRTMVSPMVTRKGSPLTGALNDAVDRVIESGLADHWLRAIPLSRRQEIRAAEPFSLRNVISAFVLHAIGLALATAVFVFERVFAPNHGQSRMLRGRMIREKRKRRKKAPYKSAFYPEKRTKN